MRAYRIVPLMAVLCATASSLRGQGIVINEVSQGPDAQQEFVEFLVTGDTLTGCGAPACLDLRGWVFDDNNGFLNGMPMNGVGIATGACRFSNDTLWSCVPAGTLITIFNNNDPNPSMPPADSSLSDGNCSLVLPINSQLFQHHPTDPNSSSSVYQTSGWLAGGLWDAVAMSNAQDGFQIYDPADLTTPVFSLGWGGSNVLGDVWLGANSANDVVFLMASLFDCDHAQGINWLDGCAGDFNSCGADDQTPGAPNTPQNAACIAVMNNGCQGPVAPSIMGDGPSCAGLCDAVAWVEVNGGVSPYTLLWNTMADTDTISGLCPGSYSVSVTDANGCDSTVSLVLVDPAPLLLDTLVTPESCAGDCNGGIAVAVTGGTAPYQYSYDGGQTYSPAMSVSELCAGGYQLVVVDTNTCADTMTVTVDAGQPYADATIAPAGPFCADDPSVTLLAAESGGTWSGPGILDADLGTFDPGSAGSGTITISYIITGTCGDLDTLLVVVEDCEPYLSVSNVFTPNGDLVNDLFTVQGNRLVDLHGQVYNRYGQLIHEWQGIRGGWDGRTYAGEPCSEGTYFYVVTAKADDGQEFEQHGSFTLLR